MSNNQVITKGNEICKDLLDNNQDDHLTTLVTNEVSSIISQMDSIESEIESANSILQKKKRELEIKKKKEQQLLEETK